MSGHEGKTCPIWVGYLLLNPLRNLYQSPKKILGPFIREGMIVLDFGCAMGFFTLPLARMVEAGGKVIAVIHEVSKLSRTFTEFHHLLKPKGKLLVAEPKGHVSGEDFKASLLTAERCGFVMENTPEISRTHAVLLSKKTTTT